MLKVKNQEQKNAIKESFWKSLIWFTHIAIENFAVIKDQSLQRRFNLNIISVINQMRQDYQFYSQ